MGTGASGQSLSLFHNICHMGETVKPYNQEKAKGGGKLKNNLESL